MDNIKDIFLWFLLYSCIGWIYETILCSVKERRFINRGFLNGPYCPIYGVGAVVNLLALGRFTNPAIEEISQYKRARVPAGRGGVRRFLGSAGTVHAPVL